MDCRLCLEICEIRSPCNCKGSIGFIHKECLKQELIVTGNKCSICNFMYIEDYRAINKTLAVLHVFFLLEFTLIMFMLEDYIFVASVPYAFCLFMLLKNYIH